MKYLLFIFFGIVLYLLFTLDFSEVQPGYNCSSPSISDCQIEYQTGGTEIPGLYH